MITGMFWSSGSVLVSKCYMFGTYDLGKYIFSDMYFCHLFTLAFLTTKDLAREVYQAKLHSSVFRISDNLQLPSACSCSLLFSFNLAFSYSANATVVLFHRSRLHRRLPRQKFFDSDSLPTFA